MKKVILKSLWICLAVSLIFGLKCQLSAQTSSKNERYNLAVYATGTQNDQPLSANLLTVVQNKTITKLTVEGDYQLIERSGEFLKEIQSEQKMQQSGEVADGQIAEIGAGYGAEKVCVVSVTIINKYLYIATRIVDVATKTSYESGDAEVNNYKDIPVLTKTLDVALSKMLSIAKRNPSLAKPVFSPQPPQNELPTKVINSTQPTSTEQPTQTILSSQPVQPVETSKPNKVVPTVPTQSVISQMSDNNPSNQTVAEVKAQATREKVEAKKAKTDFDMGFYAYKKQVIKEKGGFLEVNSLAYKEYRKWKGNMISGAILFAIGSPLTVVSVIAWDANSMKLHRDYFRDHGVYPRGYWLPYAGVGLGSTITIIGIIQLSTMNKHLQKSYQYYLNGDQRTVSWQITPYFSGNDTFGAGLSLRF